MGMQRKKQYPDLAYRTSEVIGTDSRLQSKDAVDLRTRSEERNFGAASKSGPRSRSAEPSVGRQHQKKVMIQSYPPLASGHGALMPKMEELPSLAEGVQKNTEYRSQFAWPRHSGGKICTARKSVSMGLIKAPDQPDASVPPKTKDTLGAYQKLSTQEEEVESVKEKPVQDSKKKIKTEYKAKYKPFTSYVYIDGQWKKTSRLVKIPEHHGPSADYHPWYSEVMERLQRANEYKCRGHGHPIYGELVPVVYSKESEATPLVRPRKELPELHTPIVPIHSKSADGKKKDKKEKHDRKTHSAEKKPEQEIKASSKRPKSADPTKGRKLKIQQRPQTAPPPVKERPVVPVPAHHAYARKSATKALQSETRMKSTPRPLTSKKVREDTTRPGLPSDGRASRTSYHPPASSSGKVWLQAGAPAQTAPSERESFKGKHSDAVRPSTLLPPQPKSPPPIVDEEPAVPTTSEHVEGKESAFVMTKPSPAPVSLTHVQTPEEVTGVKSPEPENWTVPLDKGKKLQWTESSTNEPLLSQAKIASPRAEVLEKEKVGKDVPELTAVPTETGFKSVTTTTPDAQKPSSSVSVKMTTADVLDRARSRLDQFWGKNK